MASGHGQRAHASERSRTRLALVRDRDFTRLQLAPCSHRQGSMNESPKFHSILVIPSLNRYQPITLSQLATMTSRKPTRLDGDLLTSAKKIR
jgi:hypothetical protein